MRTFRLAILTAAVALAGAQPAAAGTTVAGRLSCDVSSGVGMILEQKQTLRCLFKPVGGGTPEPYLGRIDEFGLAIGTVGQGHLVWGVVAPASGVPHGALSGSYFGVGAQASLGVGAGANVLVGGTGRAFSLQPISVEGELGLNIAGGVTTVTLLPPPK